MINENLMGIPDEIWDTILNQKRINVQDMAMFRSVNKKTNALADNFFNRWIIKLNDRFEHDEKRGPYLETLLNLRVDTVFVTSFLEPLSFRPQGVVFKFPDLLKDLIIEFENDKKYDLLVSPENLHVFLKSRNLKVLALGLVEENVNSPIYSSQPPLIGYDFSQLQELDLEIRQEKEQLKLVQGNLLDKILKSSIYEKLYSVKFVVQTDIGSATAYQMNCDMLKFIVKYGHTLTSVNFSVNIHQESSEGFPHSLESLDVSHLKNCSSLSSLSVTSNFLDDSWRALIKVQTKLNELDLAEVSVPVGLLRTVIERNYRTLCSVKILDLDVNTAMADRHFDFAIFSICQNLTLLHLSIEDPVPKGRNLLAIHQNLKEMRLRFLLSSADLMLFSFNHMKLKTLTISDAGTLGNFGVNGSVLESLLALTELSDIQIDEESINLAVPAETVKLESLLDTLGISFDPGDDICLKRDPNSNLWCNKCERSYSILNHYIAI